MALKNFKPVTSTRRHLVLVDHSELHKGKPVKKLTVGLTGNGGRNNFGRITARRRGGGHKRRYRMVDFKRQKYDVTATVERLEYDPNRTAFIALVKYEDGELSYILAPQRLSVGDQVVSGKRCDIKPGNAMPFSGMPIGTIVHNIELKPGKGGQVAVFFSIDGTNWLPSVRNYTYVCHNQQYFIPNPQLGICKACEAGALCYGNATIKPKPGYARVWAAGRAMSFQKTLML